MDISGKTWKTIILILVVVIVVALLIWWLASRGSSGSSGDSLKSDSFGQSGNSLKSSTDANNTGNARASGTGGNSLFSWARKMMGGGDTPAGVEQAHNTAHADNTSRPAAATAANSST